MVNLIKSIWRFSGKYFRNRNVIVVSEGEVKHYPVSSKLQFLGLFAVMGVLSWGSYSTGSYFAAQSILEEKERKIASTTLVNRRMGEQFSLLKHDLTKLQGKADTLNEYDRFVVEQHSTMADAIPETDTDVEKDGTSAEELAHIGQNLLQERINYLEGLVDQLKVEQEDLVTTLHTRTQDQISVFEDIIKATGLNLAKLTKHPEAKLKIEEIQSAESEETEVEQLIHQGGPFVPAAPMTQIEGENALFKDVNQMMLLSDIVSVLPLAKPMEEARVSSAFGRRVDPITKKWALHRGLDFVGAHNGEVRATSTGVVTHAARNGAYGRLVEIDHGYGITTRYAHLRKISVEKGDKVEAGQVVGLQGNSGRSTGSHLHYEVRFNRIAQNPKKFIEASEHVFKE